MNGLCPPLAACALTASATAAAAQLVPFTQPLTGTEPANEVISRCAGAILRVNGRGNPTDKQVIASKVYRDQMDTPDDQAAYAARYFASGDDLTDTDFAFCMAFIGLDK